MRSDLSYRPQQEGLMTRPDLASIVDVNYGTILGDIRYNNDSFNELVETVNLLRDENENLKNRMFALESHIRNEGGRPHTLGLRIRTENDDYCNDERQIEDQMNIDDLRRVLNTMR